MQLEKPKKGEACNGCGVCCIAEQCPVSIVVFGEKSLCPALKREDSGYFCDLTRNSGQYLNLDQDWKQEWMNKHFAELIGVGVGCDSEESP
jgi:hypothetical protein